MAKTYWALAPYYDKQQWLLADGTIVASPDVETTSSQRRWRLVGSEKSVSRHDLDDLILSAIDNLARQRGTFRWLRLWDDDLSERFRQGTGTHGQLDFSVAPAINLDKRSSIPVAFEFVSPQFSALRAILWVVLSTDGAGRTWVSTCLTYRNTHPQEGTRHLIGVYRDGVDWDPAPSLHQHSEEIRSLKQVLARIKPVDDALPLMKQNYGNARKGIARFVELLRIAASLEEVSIPDLRLPTNPSVLRLKSARTNYSTGMYQEILDVVQTGPVLERLKNHLDGITTELTRLGIVTSVKDRFDLNALLGGKLSELQCVMTPNEDDEEGDGSGIDRDHRVTLDLAHGVLVVHCDHQTDRDDMAAAWEVARFKAELSGETDVLLAYAQAWNRPREQRRLKKILDQAAVDIT